MSTAIGSAVSDANIKADAAVPGKLPAFSWDNATVYFLLTDRFCNGDTSNDHSYGRGLDQDGNVVEGYKTEAAFQGDEFSVILQNDDYNNREKLVEMFEKRRKEICDSAKNKWEEVNIALGIAVYDPENENAVADTMRRADKIMYENKRIQKNSRST